MDDDDKPIGELFGRLIDEGKAYARAEAGLAKAQAEVKLDRAKRPALLGLAALGLVLGGLVALVLTLVFSLSSLLGPLAGGLLATAITFAVAGLLGFLAKRAWDQGA